MSAQTYMKIWTPEPTADDKVQVLDLLSYGYRFEKPTTGNGEISGGTKGGDIRVTVSGFPSDELLAWMFGSRLQKDGEIVDVGGHAESPEEHILFKGAHCMNFRIHSDKDGAQLIMLVHADSIDFGDSCYSNNE